MQSEFHYPHTTDRGTRRDWEEGGSLDMRGRARLQARQILQTHYPQQFSPTLDQQLRDRFNILLPHDLMAA
jgi:trimethylamine--corrinoid protein Co-methyltransferase